jgi:transposase
MSTGKRWTVSFAKVLLSSRQSVKRNTRPRLNFTHLAAAKLLSRRCPLCTNTGRPHKDANDPGCVKTLFRCYDSLVILRGNLMRRFVEEADRGQWTLLPECLDDFIDESNPFRVIDVFVDALDLAEMSFEGVEPAATGRPSYHPSVLLKLYIYGYLNRVQSSRRLEREAGRNVEVMWLLGRLAPDHKTIADFRKDNGLALRKVCARFVELCREMGLLATRASPSMAASSKP